jgi:hypothetical protein
MIKFVWQFALFLLAIAIAFNTEINLVAVMWGFASGIWFLVSMDTLLDHLSSWVDKK